MWPWLKGLLPGPEGTASGPAGGCALAVLAGAAALSGRPSVTYTAANAAIAATAAAPSISAGVRCALWPPLDMLAPLRRC
jgi:hypothetical protein